ncbi:MAG: hypothetical protein IJV41_01920 [Oscillospiraceae bacterium]|nr:hypothetical protein [Oscillospiraceae bacterium]
MPDRVANNQADRQASIREAVSINTRKIFDSCRDKDCIDDLRVYPTESSQTYIDSALSIRPRTAELLYVDVNVEPVSFNRGYYTVDCSYFYSITGETFPAGQTVTGLAVFDKRVMLFGSVGSVKSYYSDSSVVGQSADELPIAAVSAVDPICLHCKLADAETIITTELEHRSIPEGIRAVFSEKLILADTPRRWLATIGQFSIVRLERDTQIIVPAYDYGMPDKECPDIISDDPCTLFSRINFPVEEFFPPDSISETEDYNSLR